MKRFKIGFLAVIAILAMSFTVASKQGVFNKKTLAGTCVQNVDLQAVTINSTSYTRGVEDCPTPSLPACVSTFTLENTSGDFNCQGSDQKFCCAKVGSIGDCDPDTEKRVTSILCYEP